MGRLIDADKFKDNMDYVCDVGGWLEPVTRAVTEYVKKQIDAQPSVDPSQSMWIPFTFRALDEHEKEIYPDWTSMFTCELPNSGDDILVSDGKYTWCDTFWNEEFCSLESDREIHEGMAWMPFPEPHKQEKTK